MEKIRVAFMGTPDYAGVILKEFIKNSSQFDVVIVYTQPDKKIGRKQVITAPIVKDIALEHNIEVLQPEKLNQDDAKYLRSKNIDFLIVAAYGQILSKEILDIAIPINLHASILPFARGASPIQEAIIKNEKLSGVTAMLMDIGLDTGNILGYSFVNIFNKNSLQLFEELASIASKLAIKTVLNYKKINKIKQFSVDFSYAKKILKEDGLIDFDDSNKIYLKYLAYINWPGIYLNSGLKLIDIELINQDSLNTPATIESIGDGYIIVNCRVGRLRVNRLQPQSKSAMDPVSYLRGKRLNIGDILS